MSGETVPTSARSGSRSVVVYAVLVSLIAAGLAAQVAWLTRTNGQLRAQLEFAQRAAGAKNTLQPDDRVEDLVLRARDGTALSTSFAADPRATLVVVVSASCPHCASTLPVWGMVAQGERQLLHGALAIDIDAANPGAIVETPAGLDACMAPDGERTWLRRLSLIPAAVLVAPDGRVLRVWSGEIAPTRLETTIAELRKAILDGGR